MFQKPNSIEKFWKELKRRKVIHVITVYAAVAFVILQLVDIVVQPLRLPDWTIALVIILLCIGFVIAVFLSWVYDITPGGVKKTKPVSELKRVDQTTHAVSSGWKITTYISGVVIMVLVAFNFINRRRTDMGLSKLEKSIAVLPFINDSPSDSTTYFINGLMDEILINLQKIGAFSRVLSRNSVEQFRNNKTKSTPEIAKALNVNFIVEGSGQKYGNTFRLRVQLIAANNERHLWAESYEKEIHETKDIYGTQSEIAQSIASALKATITPGEKQLIEKSPTTDLTAYDFYQRGNEEHAKYKFDIGNTEILTKAEALYKKALEYDPTFAQAYTGLAKVYWDKHNQKEYFSEYFMDSVLFYTKVALSYNDQLDEAYTIRGNYYYEKGLPEQAIKEFDKALKLNPNDWMAYFEKAGFYFSTDLVNHINYLQKAASLNHGPELPDILRSIAYGYQDAGFTEKAKYYALEAFKLDGDSVKYFNQLGYLEHKLANYEKSVEFLERSYDIDATNIFTLALLGTNCGFAGQMEKSLKYYKEFVTRIKNLGAEHLFYGAINHRIGYAYWKNGYREESEYYFNKQLEECNNQIKSIRPWSQMYYTYYDIAGVYAFRGDKDKAYKNLRIFNQRKLQPLWILSTIKNDPLFNSMRNEPEFQQIVRDVEAKYQAQHVGVKKWLEETGQL